MLRDILILAGSRRRRLVDSLRLRLGLVIAVVLEVPAEQLDLYPTYDVGNRDLPFSTNIAVIANAQTSIGFP